MRVASGGLRRSNDPVQADPVFLFFHTKIAAFAIAGALNWICMWYEPDGALSADEIATQFARTLTQGLAGRKPSIKLRIVTEEE